MLTIRNIKTGKRQSATKEQYEKLKQLFPGSFAKVGKEPDQVAPETVDDGVKLDIVESELVQKETALKVLKDKKDLTGQEKAKNNKDIRTLESEIQSSKDLIKKLKGK